MDKPIYVTRSSMPSKQEYFQEISDLWESHFLTNMGVKHQQLEKDLKQYLQVPYLSLFSNGHMALELTIQAMGLKGEVITTPFTFASTTHAIVRNGLEPVFCDINEKDYTIDADKIEKLITKRTSAIIPVHVYGHICQMEKMQRLADAYHLKVIYDAAHAFGETYQDVGVASFGEASMLSFHATKVFNTIEGGAVCYQNQELGEKLYRLKNFGIRSETIIDGIGANAKMNEFQAAMGICNLRHVNEEIAKRKRVVEQYRTELVNVDGVILPPIQKEVKSNYSYFPILIQEKNYGLKRDDLYHKLKEHNIFTRRYFYPLTNSFDCYEGRFSVEATPIAKRISQEVLTLPLYADLSLDTVKEICDKIKDLRRY